MSTVAKVMGILVARPGKAEELKALLGGMVVPIHANTERPSKLQLLNKSVFGGCELGSGSSLPHFGIGPIG